MVGVFWFIWYDNCFIDIMKLQINWDNPKDVNRLFCIIREKMFQINNVKIIEVKWDDKEQITKLYQSLKGRMLNLNTDRLTRNERHRIIQDCCEKIFNADISSIYEGMKLDENPIYYTYAHLDTSKHITIGVSGKSTFLATLGINYLPFYIGKGVGDRCYDINRNETHRKVKQKLIGLNKEIEIYKIKDGLTEKEALIMESKFIDMLGLIPTGGKLSNLDEGMFSKERRLLYKKEFDILNNKIREDDLKKYIS